MSDTITSLNLHQLTAQIVSAHVSRAALPAETLPELIRIVHQALTSAGSTPTEAKPDRSEPAVPVKHSVFPDHIICLEDGKSFKTLKRHLQKVYGMTPGQYRERWGLPPSYPMVAPAYAEHRSKLAKSSGLGRKPDVGAAEAPAEVEAAPLAKKRGRPMKVAVE